jgi:Phage integrase family
LVTASEVPSSKTNSGHRGSPHPGSHDPCAQITQFGAYLGSVKSLTLEQAVIVMAAARKLPAMELRPGLKDVRRPAALMYAYIVLSLLVGVRTEEARALRWPHVYLDGDPGADPSIPPHVAVWRSVRVHGETKTERSRRTLGLPQMAVEALRALLESQADERLLAGEKWQDGGLVFTTHLDAALDAGNVRKMFKRVCTSAGIGDGWTPRELRTSFVSLMSHRGVRIEEIARLVGHASTWTTEVVYRRELRPVITTGAGIMDEVFPGRLAVPTSRRRQRGVSRQPRVAAGVYASHRPGSVQVAPEVGAGPLLVKERQLTGPGNRLTAG